MSTVPFSQGHNAAPAAPAAPVESGQGGSCPHCPRASGAPACLPDRVNQNFTVGAWQK